MLSTFLAVKVSQQADGTGKSCFTGLLGLIGGQVWAQSIKGDAGGRQEVSNSLLEEMKLFVHRARSLAPCWQEKCS